MSGSIVLARHGQTLVELLPALATRHGCITGATGTGKTVTLQVLAEAFSRAGVPVFMADVKGDLSGISQAGQSSTKLVERLKALGMPEPAWSASPTVFWDVFGKQGVPVRATVSDMGPLLLSRMLGLNDTQEGVLSLVFRVADDEGQLLLDLKDLRAMLTEVSERAAEIKTRYGNVSAASVGAIQRGLLALESQGAALFFGEPMLDIADLMQVDDAGHGVVNVLAADALMQSPQLYGIFLLWLLADIYEQLPEVGDLAQPKFVFFFDEAHLLFKDAPTALMQKVEQVVRLIRSKGVGVYFVTQNPLDIPDAVLGQFGNRVQHALRAFTPRDQKAVRAAAQTMRPNPGLDIEAAITELGVGEALISLLDEKGRPMPTQRAWIVPPASRIGPANAAERQATLNASPLMAKYGTTVDRQSAYEVLRRRAQGEDPSQDGNPPAQAHVPASQGGFLDSLSEALFGSTGPRGGWRDGIVQSVAKSSARTAVRELTRGIWGSLLGGRKRR